MKKLHSLLLTASALTAVSIGSTYAWFTAADADTLNLSFGELGVKTEFTDLGEDGIGLEPGLTIESTGTIANTGSLYSLVKIENDSQVKYKSTSDFVPVPEGTISFEISPENDIYQDWDSGVLWFKDAQESIYLLMDPGSNVAVDVDGLLNGENIDNSFMGSKVNFNLTTKAVQALDEAVLSEFEIDLDQLIEIGNEGISSRGISPAKQYLFEVMGRN